MMIMDEGEVQSALMSKKVMIIIIARSLNVVLKIALLTFLISFPFALCFCQSSQGESAPLLDIPDCTLVL